MGINDYGGLTDPLNAPPLGGPAGWAAAVAAALDGDDTTVNARIEAYAAPLATVGNLLTANQASGTDTLGTTVGFSPAASTLSSDNSVAHTGARSLRVESTGTTGRATIGGNGTTADGTIPVTPGQVYTYTVQTYATTGNARRFPRIYWYNASLAVLSNSAGTAEDLGTGAWKSWEFTAVAPAGAAYASVALMASSSVTAGTVHWEDSIGFWAGAGGQWAMPGVPITGLGKRVTHPNESDVLVEQWDDTQGRWQRSFYHSGVRNVTVTTAGKLSRVNDTVTWTGTGTPPTGFRDSLGTGGKIYQTTDPLPSSLPGTLDSVAPA